MSEFFLELLTKRSGVDAPAALGSVMDKLCDRLAELVLKSAAFLTPLPASKQ